MSMFTITSQSIEWAGKTLTLETGRVARQADGAVMVSYGDTKILCAVVAKKTATEGVDFFPLTINYLEKAYAAGKIPGGFFKREAKPSERETLISRLIDRPIRPLFPEGFNHEVQVTCTVVSYDEKADSDVAALVGASAALAISGAPFMGPIGAAKVGYVDGEYTLNPSLEELENSQLELIVAATEDSVMMVESEADSLSEEIMLGAVNYGHEQMQPVIELINEFKQAVGNESWQFTAPEVSDLYKEVSGKTEANFREAYALQNKQERATKLDEIRKETLESYAENEAINNSDVSHVLKKIEKDIVRSQILEKKVRIDGRKGEDVRQIDCQVGILPKVHGSALFTRGETQALVVTTLGTAQDEQIIDNLVGDNREHFLLHYNFPPYSVGEASMLRPPGRREIGHGKLAWRALHALVPTKEEFPYTIRMVSEITESNGSSSMASVCGSSLAMMDAGVPIKKPVAGIAMGLIKKGDEFAVLSDIMGDEDHLGDMDFKVAGPEDGITALQMDIKIAGITKEIMEIALAQANQGRKHILGEMSKCIQESRKDLNDNAPTITNITVNKNKIRDIIGSGGKNIREICEVSGAKVDIDDSGLVSVAAVDKASGDKALQMIKDIITDVEIGMIFDGNVERIVDFGAFVSLPGKQEGLVHISELTEGRVEKVTDVLAEKDVIKVKVIGLDRGKIRLSMRAVDQDTGEALEVESHQKPERSGKPPRKKPHSSNDDNANQDNNNEPQDSERKKKRRFFGQ